MPKVMVIDDDKNMLSLLDTFLTLEGYQVAKIGGGVSLKGEEVHRAIQHERPDLIIMDVHLNKVSGLDGFDLLHRLREEPDLSGTYVLMSSGIDFSQKCKRAGADGFMMKPFMPEELLNQIRKYLGP
ncbi:MAG TPA: response regulator [Anaerolineales bacterium]|jgi:DNA-binding response OmpR family regulator